MNKTILTIVILLLSVASIYGQKRSVVAKGKIKTLVVYEQKGGEKAIKESETKFDSEGNVIEEIEYKDNKVSKHQKYEYNSDGDKIKEIEIDALGKTTKTTEIKYDSDGKKIKETELNALGKLSKTIEYKYNGDFKTEKTVYDGNKKLKSKKTYQYQTY